MCLRAIDAATNVIVTSGLVMRSEPGVMTQFGNKPITDTQAFNHVIVGP